MARRTKSSVTKVSTDTDNAVSGEEIMENEPVEEEIMDDIPTKSIVADEETAVKRSSTMEELVLVGASRYTYAPYSSNPILRNQTVSVDPRMAEIMLSKVTYDLLNNEHPVFLRKQEQESRENLRTKKRSRRALKNS